MSGFVAIVDPSHQLTREPDLTRMLAALSSRGDRVELSREGESVLAVARFSWELADEFSGPALIVHDDDISVGADATIYHQADLLQRLAASNVRPRGRTAAHLIAAAYRAWGADCTQYLEGDFAFVVLDRKSRRTFAARDFMGRRPLYYAEVKGALIVASTISTIVAHPSVRFDLDDVAIAEFVGVSLAGHANTPYREVFAVPAATSLVRNGSGSVTTRQYWTLDVAEAEPQESFEDASERLSAMLSLSIIERRAQAGPTTIWLSGGYDSPVMYGVGNAALDRNGFERLMPISFSHPVGDAGREDELIQEITNFWQARPTWLSIQDVPLLGDAREHAARADFPFQHAFENWMRALLGATALNGSRVALYGDGGDQLFAVSTVFLRDLFSDLHWGALRREWRAFGGAGVRSLWRSVARPALSSQVRARRQRHHSMAGFPAWLARDFIARTPIEQRQAAAEHALSSGGGGEAGEETRRSLGNPVSPRVRLGLNAFGLEHGVELRAPLLDRRIVEFALQRPRHERASDGAVKHLLRRTARELLPESILAPRAAKTGVLTDYFANSFRADPDAIVTDVLSQSRLVDRGIIDGAVLQQAWREYKSHGKGQGGHLFVVFQTELWLQARDIVHVKTTDSITSQIRMPSAGFVQ